MKDPRETSEMDLDTLTKLKSREDWKELGIEEIQGQAVLHEEEMRDQEEENQLQILFTP